MRIVPVEHASHLLLAEDAYDQSSRVLIKKGVTITEKVIEQLKHAGIYSVYVNDKYSQNTLTPPIPTDLKVSMIRELQSLYDMLRQRFEAGKDVTEGTMEPMNKVLELADDIVYEVMHSPRQYLSFTDIKVRDVYTVSHSVNVAVLSLLLGIDLALDRKRLPDLFLGALFHDIGMNFINEKVFMKDGKLDVHEFVKIKEHPQKGYDLIKNFSFANAYIKIIILEHHEKLDGTGYPKQQTANEIHQLAQIVAVADVYDAMTSDRVYSRAVAPALALEHLTHVSKKHLDPHLVDLFIKKIAPYPEGCLVKLSNQRIGLVQAVHNDDPLRPLVVLIDPLTKELEDHVLDLELMPNLKIEGLQYEIE